MRSTFSVILGVLAVSLLASSSVCALPTWGDCILTVYGSSQFVTLKPSYEASGSGWIYTYVLDNTSTSDITAFTLTLLPPCAPASSCTPLDKPAGWVWLSFPSFNYLNGWNATGDDIGPGQTGTFKFSSPYGPSSDKPGDASGQNALGFSGKCYAPIPEPTSLVALLAGIGGLVGFVTRRKA